MSMNHLCGCTGVSASKLGLSKQQEISNSCKICGGKPLVDGQGALRAGMLSNIGLEISGVIDPHLNWRTASKGKPRAVRRARTSFTSTRRQRPLEKVREKNEDIINKETNKSKEMPVSESEKLGVTILGQRFSDTIESVPIKKRRFLFRSPSPPLCHPYQGDESGHSSVTRVMSPKVGTVPGSSGREHSVKINTKNKAGLADNTEEQLCDAADFSGISILAAAACNSSSVEDAMNTENLDSNQFSFKGEGLFDITESQSGFENKVTEEKAPDMLPTLNDKIDTSLVSTTKLSSRGEDASKMDGLSLEEDSSSSLSTVFKKDNGSLQGTGSLRDGRFPWDLNTVMESWESPDDVPMDSQRVASVPVCENDIHMGRVDKLEVSEKGIVEDHSESVGIVMDKTVDLGRPLLGTYKSENLVGSSSPCGGLVADHDNGSVEEPCLGCAPIQMTSLVEEMDDLNTGGSIGFTNDVECSLPGRAPDPVGNSPSANSYPSEEDKTDMNGLGVDSTVDAERTSNFLLNGSASTANLMCTSKPNYVVDKTSYETVLSEKVCTGSEVELIKCSDDCGSTDVQVREAVQAAETVFQNDQDACKPDDCHVRPIGKKVSDILPGGNLCNISANYELEGDIGETEPFSVSNIIHQSMDPENGTCLSKFSALMSKDHKDNSDGCMTNEERRNSDNVKLQDMGTILPDQGGNDMKSDWHIKSKESVPAHMIDGHPLMGEPNDINKGYKGHLLNSPVENALDDHFDCDYYSDNSQNEQAIGMGNAEQQGDDESQYEDGEFRESFVHSWEVDGCDEGEAEHVDYGSDNREIDSYEAASDYPAPNISYHIGSSECKDEGLQEDCHAEEDHNMHSVKVEPNDFSSSVALVSDIGTITKRSASFINKGPSISHSRRKYVCKTWENSTKDATVSVPADNVVEEMELVAKSDRQWSHSASLRIKSSGWDRLPGGHRISEDAVADSDVDTSDMKLDNVPEKLTSVGSTLGRELSSQIGGPKSPDILHRKDRGYFRGTRNRDRSVGTRHDVKRDIELSRSVRTDDSSIHVHRRGRGDRWMESSSHQGSSRHGSPGYYGLAGFSHPGSKNAAAASIAKVESNGFVVAPDGTVLEASGGHSGRLPRRSANSSPNARHAVRRRGSPGERDGTLSFNESQLDLGPRRDLSPARHISVGHGRPGRYGPKSAGEGNMERYHGFIPGDNIGSSMPVHPSFSRRDRSFSPQTRTLPVSRSNTRSRSPSRTRSPHVWTSPRRNNLMNNGLRRRTRSPPGFRSEARVGRVRSPHGRSGFSEHVASFPSSQRNRASPSPASRWIDERKDLVEHLRDNDFRRFSGKSPPKRLFSRDHRFNPVDSSGRVKPDDFYRPISSSRFPGFGVGRRPRPDDGNGSRRHVEHYEMLPSARQYDVVGDSKQLRYETEEGFRLHNNRSKNTPDFPERGSPRSFDRGVGSQLNNSPPRVKEDMSHFRYGRDGKHKTRYKTYELRREDGTTQRRHS